MPIIDSLSEQSRSLSYLPLFRQGTYFAIVAITTCGFLFSRPATAQLIVREEWNSDANLPSDSGARIDINVPPSPAGGSALRFTYAAGKYDSSFSAGRVAFDFAPQDELWIGHWNFYSPGFVFNGNGTKMDFLILADAGAYNFRGNMAVGWKGNPFAPTSVASNQIVWGPTTQDFAVNYTAEFGKWVWIEEHFRINTPGEANGLYEFYVNDELKGRHENVPYRDKSVTRGWGTFFHTAEWGGGGTGPEGLPADQYWWVDHTVISTKQIGINGSGGPFPPPTPPPPTTPTEPSTNLKVSLSLSTLKVTPGQTFTVDVSGTVNDPGAWAALYLASNPDSSYSYKSNFMYLNGTKTKPESTVTLPKKLTFTAPMESGSYNIRLFATEDIGQRLAISLNITVAEAIPDRSPASSNDSPSGQSSQSSYSQQIDEPQFSSCGIIAKDKRGNSLLASQGALLLMLFLLPLLLLLAARNNEVWT